ncbi:hypothetical protein ERJ75_000495100 [Trypanosoma vivax]|nr:hypothetical protein ERJ75_000495100 [Trypanosoma vivax]
MKRSAKGADAMNEAVTRGIRIAAKRTIPKGKGVAPPFWTPELTKLDKMVQECKKQRKRDALIRWRRKVLADTAVGRWKENVAKLSVTESASWNLVKSIYAPRPLTSPVLVVDGHPLTKPNKAQKHWPKCTWPGQRRHHMHQNWRYRAQGDAHSNPSPRRSWISHCVSCLLARRREMMRSTVRS